MSLDRVPLRLTPALRAEVQRLLGDRGLNVCLTRAVELWVRVERGEVVLAEGGQKRAAVTHAPAVPAPVAEVETRDDELEAPSRPVAPVPPDIDEDLGEAPVVDTSGPRRRRTPQSAGSWGTRAK